MKPEFPLKVIFNDGDEWILNTVEEVEGSLEWFDSDDPEEEATILDKLNNVSSICGIIIAVFHSSTDIEAWKRERSG